MKTLHTPAPWTVSDQDINGIFITADNGQGAIARVYTENSLIKTTSAAKSNAQLIASAPELLQMLNSAVELLSDLGHGNHNDVAIYKEVINKATQ